MNEASPWPSTQSSLLLRIRDSTDQESWTTFVELYAPLIHRYACRRGFQDADARDVTQDILRRVAHVIRDFNYDPAIGHFRGWLGLLSRREMHRYANTPGAKVGAIGGDDADLLLTQVEGEVDPVWIDEFNGQVYRAALERTKPAFSVETWQAFEQVWVRNRQPAEVAREMNKTSAWVHKAKFNVLQRLRAEVEFIAADTGIFGN